MPRMISVAIAICALLFGGVAFSAPDQSPESLALILKPLTRSMGDKIWPKAGLRGINVMTFSPETSNSTDPGLYISEDAFKRMAGWKVNMIRLWVDVDPDTPWKVKKGEVPPPVPSDDPMLPYKRHLDGIRIALHLAEKYHMWVVITAGDIVGRSSDIMYSKSAGSGFEPELVRLWTFIAHEFGGHPNLIGYDILNEPNSKSELERWQKKTLPEVCNAIRAIDKNTYLIVEPGPFGLPSGFKTLEPIGDLKVVYSFHHYLPHTYTHQGIGSYKSAEYMGNAYPGVLRGFPTDWPKMWDRRELESSMEAAATFARKNNAIMWVGEFSAIRWAPGAAQWTRDSIDIFEKNGWSWCYHSYRGWNGWNPTFEAGDSVANDPDGGKITDRLTVLTEAWKKNSLR